ncbi:MAG TPA: acyl-CoA dehydrogenase family protein [Bdellovibrionota bacterium]|jgi:alkylation response protein AidB-like acyl-CoA dehydrogenase|nr:acyl-CoA dehydrogenase family protein [Bdellovibrionota bacterium]
MANDDPLNELRQTVRKFLQKELAPRVEETEAKGELAVDVLRKMGELGLVGPMLSEPYGLADLGAQLVVAEEMGAVCAGFGLSALASVCLFGSNVDRQGTPEQKKKYLPGVTTGQKIGCWGLTEPSAGSDAISIKTRCVREDDHYLINGSKTFITNAPIADYFIILARESGGPQDFAGGTAFILERGMAGLRTGQPFHKMGHLSSPTGEVFMENVKVPASQVLGQPGGAFLGMKVSLDVERAIFGGLGAGMMRFCVEAAVKYGAQRKQFGAVILEHQMIQEKIADMTSKLELTQTYLRGVVQALQEGRSQNLEAAIAKYMGSKFCVEVASDAVQCMGGYGYMREYQVERCLRDAKLFEIGGGTSEIQKMIIAKQAVKGIMEGRR